MKRSDGCCFYCYCLDWARTCFSVKASGSYGVKPRLCKGVPGVCLLIFYCFLFVLLLLFLLLLFCYCGTPSNLCTGIPAVPPSSAFPDHPSPLLLPPCKCNPPCPPPPPPCRPRDRLELSQLQQHPRHRLLQDPLKAQPHEVHHVDDQLPLLARLPGRLRRARPRRPGEGSETSFSPPIHSHHSQVLPT